MPSRMLSIRFQIQGCFKSFCLKILIALLTKTSFMLISIQEKSALTARITELTARITELTARHDELTARHDELTARHDELTARHDELTARHDELTARNTELTARHDELTARNTELGTYLIANSRNRLLQFLVSIDEFSSSNLLGTMLRDSKSQLMQDVLALFVSGKADNPGYFIEIGACDGISFSNSFFLEKNFGWKGIAVEPARVWEESLTKNRNCKLDFRAVTRFSGRPLLFSETQDPMYSTFSSLTDKDLLGELRLRATEYLVPTVSLGDLLHEHGAPAEIDYLSIDTEGSDYDILQGLDFEKYFIKFISVEHNHTDDERLIDDLLLNSGFNRILKDFSLFDAWYINSKYTSAFTIELKI